MRTIQKTVHQVRELIVRAPMPEKDRAAILRLLNLLDSDINWMRGDMDEMAHTQAPDLFEDD